MRRSIGRAVPGGGGPRMPPSGAAVVDHAPLLCAGCGGMIKRSLCLDPAGPGSLTICTGCGTPIHLDGPIWATRASVLDIRNQQELMHLRLGFANAGIALPSPRAPMFEAPPARSP